MLFYPAKLGPAGLSWLSWPSQAWSDPCLQRVRISAYTKLVLRALWFRAELSAEATSILYVLQKWCYGCGKNATDTPANRYNMLSSGCAKACIREIC